MENFKKLNLAALVLVCFCLQWAAKAQDSQSSAAAAELAVAEAKKLRALGTADGALRAIKKYEEALAIWRGLGDKSNQADTLQTIGEVYQRMGEAERSLEYFDQSLALARAAGNKEIEAGTLLFAGQSHRNLGDPRRALDFYARALGIAGEIKPRSLEAQSLEAQSNASLGYVHFQLGQPQTALNYFNQALPLLRAINHKDAESMVLISIGKVYNSLGESQRAIDYFLQALAIARERSNHLGEATVLNDIGAAYDSLGERQKAIDYFNQTLQLWGKLGNRFGESVTMGNLALQYDQLGDWQKALELYDQALAIQRRLKVRAHEAATLSNIGNLHFLRGDYQKAFDHYSEALPIRRESGDLFGESVTLNNLARAERARGNLNEARLLIEKAIEIVESVRASLASPDLRASYFAVIQDFYKLRIDLLMQFHARQPDQGFDALALETGERARARSLLDVLSEAGADIRQGIDPALLERERALQKQINAKDVERRRAPNAAASEALEKEIQTLASAYQDLQAEIRLKSPRYAALTQPRPARLPEIQQMLDPDTLLLEYSLGNEKSYLWVVSQNSIKTFPLPARRLVEAKAREFYEAVQKPDAEEEARKAASGLSKILLEPAAKELGNKRLLIVADGALQYIPFAALPVVYEKSEEPLVVNHEIVYLPSASTLAALRNEGRNRQPAPKTLAVLADPVFDSRDLRMNPAVASKINKQNSNPDVSPTTGGGGIAVNPTLAKAARDTGFKNPFRLERLNHASQEALAISSLVAASEKKQALGFEANRAAATSPELAQYRMIHFATHGLLNSRQPELSGIVLSLVDEKGAPQDGFLRVHEVFNLKLPAADLIVLSACQTALGKDVRGEGLIGLTRGFMYAGARRVAASLWTVDDRATYQLMKIFYQGMLGEKKLRPAAALREAQITLLRNKRFAAPFYWSAFTVQGEWR